MVSLKADLPISFIMEYEMTHSNDAVCVLLTRRLLSGGAFILYFDEG